MRIGQIGIGKIKIGHMGIGQSGIGKVGIQTSETTMLNKVFDFRRVSYVIFSTYK